MEERIRHGVGGAEIFGFAQRAGDRVIRRQSVESGPQVAQIGRRRVDAEEPAVLLQHVDAGPAVPRVDHQMHCAQGAQHVA